MMNVSINPYLYGAVGIFVAIVMIIIVFYSKSNVIDQAKQKFDPVFLERLVKSLGGKENIVEVTSEHQRLKVKIVSIKDVSSEELKALDLGAFLKGKEITLLIKHHMKDVITYINEIRKED